MKIELASWLGTYWVHSSLILGSAYLLMRMIPRSSHRLRESVWKTALLAGFFTATAQSVLSMVLPSDMNPGLASTVPTASESSAPTGTGLVALDGDGSARARNFGALETGWGHPRDAAVDTPTLAGEAMSSRAVVSSTAADIHAPAASVVTATATISDASTTSDASALSPSPTSTTVSPLDSSPSRTIWRVTPALLWLIAWAWFGGALLGSIRSMRARRQLFQRIDPRTELRAGKLYEILQDLLRRASTRQVVRLTDSEQAPSPMALHRSEICIPARSMINLSDCEKRAILAHELGHIVRRDPLWLTLSHWIETLFFFQPLNRVARREMQREAEFLADDWALTHSESGLVLARCLATVADWVGAGRTNLSTVSAMAEHDSSLVDRVQRLVDGNTVPSRGVPTWLRLPLVGGLCFAVILIAPRVAARSQEKIGPDANVVPIALVRDGQEVRPELRLHGPTLKRTRAELARREYEIEQKVHEEMRQLDREGRRLFRQYRRENLGREELQRLEVQLDALENQLRALERQMLDGSAPLLAATVARKTVAAGIGPGLPSELWVIPDPLPAPRVQVGSGAPMPSATPDLWITPLPHVSTIVPLPDFAPMAPIVPIEPTPPRFHFERQSRDGYRPIERQLYRPYGDGVRTRIPS